MTDISPFPFLQHNSDDRPLPNKFLSIQSIPTNSFRPGFSGHPTAAPSGLPRRSGAGDTSATTDNGDRQPSMEGGWFKEGLNGCRVHCILYNIDSRL